VPIVFDHFAGAQAAGGLSQPGFDAVLSLLRSGRAYVKLSAPYRASKTPPYDDVAQLAQAFVATNPDRILWGSDWPHPDSAHGPGKTATDITPFLPIDDGLVLDQLARWIPEAGLRRKILVDSPARLYGF
jgi:predicted TIM-barrel fold metal-dependent hydrolase